MPPLTRPALLAALLNHSSRGLLLPSYRLVIP